MKFTLKRWQAITVTCLLIATGLGLAAYAAAASYASLSGEAAAHGVPLPYLNPLGLDGGLFGVVAAEIVLTWIRKPIWWLRLVSRLFALGTVTANAMAGWPDPISVGLRVAAPALLVILIETGRAYLLRSARDGAPERIPAARWILAPWPTFVLWRRMRLWRIRDYREAVTMELNRRKAIVQLAALHPGKDWRQAAPDDLAWMLANGVHMRDALQRVAELTAAARAEVQAETSPRNKARASSRKRPASSPRNKRPASRLPSDVDTQAEALRILAEEPGISGGELGLRLGKSKRYGCMLKNKLAASVAGPDAANAGG